MNRHFGAWLKAQQKIAGLKERQMDALRALMEERYKLVLKRGRMRPTSVIIVDVSLPDRVKIERCDTGARRWVDTHYLSDVTLTFTPQ